MMYDHGGPATRRHPGARRPGAAGRIGRLVTLLVFAVGFGYPLLAFLAVSFRSDDGTGLGGFALSNAWASWQTVLDFNGGVFLRWLVNSVVVAGGGSLIAVLAGVPAGYAMARLRFAGRRLLRFVTLLTMVIPNTVLVIPIYLEVSAIDAINNIWVVALLMGFYPFGVYLAYIHFKTTLPTQMIEAARIDGLSEVSIFLQIALPVSKQAVALVGLLQLRGQLDQLLPAARAAAAVDQRDGVGGPAAAGRRPARCSTRPRRPGSTCACTPRSSPWPRWSPSCRC